MLSPVKPAEEGDRPSEPREERESALRRETGEVRCGLVCGCCGDSRVKDVPVSHRGDRGDISTRSLRDLLLRRHGSTATTSPRQPATDDEWPQPGTCQSPERL